LASYWYPGGAGGNAPLCPSIIRGSSSAPLIAETISSALITDQSSPQAQAWAGLTASVTVRIATRTRILTIFVTAAPLLDAGRWLYLNASLGWIITLDTRSVSREFVLVGTRTRDRERPSLFTSFREKVFSETRLPLNSILGNSAGSPGPLSSC